MKFAGKFALVLCLCALGMTVPGETFSAPAAPAWRPGFPVRVGTSVILLWTPVAGAQSYKLLRKTGEGDFHEIYRGAGIAFTDAAAPSDTPLSYKVTALIDKKESAPSPVAVIRQEEPIKPPEITGAISAPGTITLRWTPPAGAAYSNVYRALSENGPYSKVASLGSNTFVDSKIEKERIYFYRISAVDRFGKESVQSRPLSASLTGKTAGASAGKPVLRMAKFLSTFRGEERYPLEQPGETGFAPGGELFVLERRNIQFFDADGNYLRRLRFAKEWGAAGWAGYDRDGTLLLSSHADQVVRRIDDEGKVIGEIRYPPAAPWMRNNPNGVAVGKPGRYWILDGVRAQVLETDNTGEPMKILGRLPGTYDMKDRRESDLPSATRIYRNPKDGIMYVVLGAGSEIKAIDPGTGKVLRTFGGLGTTNGQFQSVGGIAFRGNGNLLVLDPLVPVVKEFDREYNYIATYADVVENNRIRLSSNLPTSIAWREDSRRLYVVSSLLNIVYIFELP
ncbi:MAG: hypothetical protein PHP88_11915 [bacterium]|nr:hypothetical protein [bacterium]